MSPRRRFWLAYAAVAGVAFAILNVYWYWRSTTFVPILMPVNLSSEGSEVVATTSRFDAVTYHIGIDLALPFSREHRWIFDDANERRVWRDVGRAVVEVAVTDAEGRVVLRDISSLDPEQGWTLTNGGHAPRPENEDGLSVASLYKFVSLKPHRFERYRVSVKVVRAASAPVTYDPKFFVATVYEYVMLGAVLQNAALVVLCLLTAGIAAVIQLATRRRKPAA